MTERKRVEDDMRRAIVQGAMIVALALGIVGAMVAVGYVMTGGGN